jgi:membrane-associated phospholipid phosphatase
MHTRVPQLPASGIWRIYAYWSFWISVAFFTVYPLCNWLSARRNSTLELYIATELNVPFVPEFVWVYLSLYVLFLIPPFTLDSVRLQILGTQLVAATVFCGLIFILLPAKLGFERIVPDTPFYSELFTNLFSIDLPHNMVPSLHVVFSALILLAASDGPRPRPAKVFFIGWLVLICVSTILVHQHHLLDVVTGLFVAMMFRHFMEKGGNHA